VSFDHGVNAGKEGGRHRDADYCRSVGANSSDKRAIVASVAKNTILSNPNPCYYQDAWLRPFRCAGPSPAKGKWR
jgi:hypothetical protein